LGNLKEAVALNGQVQCIFGRNQTALGVGFFGRNDAHAGAQHQTSRRLCVGAHLSSGLTQVLVQHVFERSTVAFESGGVDVGQVVGDDRHPRLLRVQAGFGNPH